MFGRIYTNKFRQLTSCLWRFTVLISIIMALKCATILKSQYFDNFQTYFKIKLGCVKPFNTLWQIILCGSQFGKQKFMIMNTFYWKHRFFPFIPFFPLPWFNSLQNLHSWKAMMFFCKVSCLQVFQATQCMFMEVNEWNTG